MNSGFDTTEFYARSKVPFEEAWRFIIIDPARDFVGVCYSTNGYIPPYGEDKIRGFLRRTAK